MPKLAISAFGGVVPRTSDTMLKDNEAQYTQNVKLYSGELRSWRGPLLQSASLVNNVQTIYRLRNTSTNTSAWLSWASDVDAVLSPFADTSDFRLYYTGDGTPKKTNWSLATTGAGTTFPRASLNMGVPAPTSSLALTAVNGGTAVDTQTRFYVYTHVSTFGSVKEESAPSPPTPAITVLPGQNVSISGFVTPPTTGYNITHRRVYRTLSGGQTDGGYVLVAEIPVATTTLIDDLLAAALGEPLATIGWSPPPANLKGLTAMANGMLAGFVDNTVYFCEPYFPHAWPLSYAQTVPHRIVGLGSFGNALVVMTEGQPYILTGVSPDNMSSEKVPLPQPCVSKKSIATDGNGVVYAGPDGLVGIGSGFRGILSDNLFRRDEWREYAPDTIVGGIYDGKYIGAFSSSIHGRNAMHISRDDFPAMTFLTAQATDIFVDEQESALYYLNHLDNKIYRLDGDALNPFIYEWKSKRFVLPQATTWSALKVDLDVNQIEDSALYLAKRDEVRAANQVLYAAGPLGGALNTSPVGSQRLNGSVLQESPLQSALFSVTVFLFGEKGQQEAVLPITSFDPIRIPPFKSREIAIELTGTVSVRSVALATTVSELRS